MSTIKKHLTSDTKHVLPTYKKLPPIQSPPPFAGLTVTKIDKTGPGDESLVDGAVTKISSSDQKLVFSRTTIMGKSEESLNTESDVKLIGYKPLDDQKKGYIPPGSELPPCRICGVKASGLHYGVNTCEACKAFFRRTLKKNSVDFQCTCSPADRRRNLEDPPRKTTCARCRYDRCIKEGMSKDAIKIGRYTINRKRQNDREVNMLKEQGGVVGRKISESSPKSSISADSPASSVLQTVTSPEVMSPDTTTRSDGEESNVGIANKRLKTNDGKALAKGLLDSLTNSLFQNLLQNQDSPVLKSSLGQEAELSPLEQLYMKPFEATTENGQYKTKIQVEKEPQRVGPVSVVNSAGLQTGGKIRQFVNESKIMPKQPSDIQGGSVGMVQNESVTSSQHNVEMSVQSPFKNPQTSPLVSTSGIEEELSSEKKEKSLIETLFEASGTIPVQNETSAIENLFRQPRMTTPSTMTPLQTQSTYSSVTSQQDRSLPTFSEKQIINTVHDNIQHDHLTGTANTISSNRNLSQFPGKQMSNMSTEENSEDILSGDGLFNGDPLNFPLESLNDKEIATKLKSMQEFQQSEEDSLGPFEDSFNLSDEAIASKLKSMQAHMLENDTLIASKLKSMEEQDFDPSELMNGLTGNESDLITAELESMSKQYDEECEASLGGACQKEAPVLSRQELTEFEMHQPQKGLPKGQELPSNADELQSICTTMVDTALASYVCPLKLSCEEIKERHKAYLEQYLLKTKVFGDMNNIPQEEYLEFYNQTGIDIDNRQQILIEYLKYAEQCISELVTFSKVIPGFTDLLLDDQVTLLKAARFSTLMIKDGLYGGQCQATAYQVATMPWNKEYHFEELKKVAPLKMFDMKAEVYEKVFEIGMTVDESIIVKAMAITYPKNEEILQPDKVEAIHNTMTECLLYTLQKRKTGKKPSLTSIFELLFYLREKSVTEQQYMVEMFETWPLTNNHQLLKEFVS